MYDLSIVSRLMTFTRETSRPDNSIFPGIRSIPSSWCRIPSVGSTSSSLIKSPIMVASVTSKVSGSVYPKLAVKLPCASASISRTFLPCFASPIPKLLVVVVFPTPPFWFAIAIILHMIKLSFASAMILLCCFF